MRNFSCTQYLSLIIHILNNLSNIVVIMVIGRLMVEALISLIKIMSGRSKK